MTTAVTDTKKNPVAAFSGFLEKFKPQLALALPKHLTADRMARLALTAFSTTPKLQDCEPMSIAASVMTAGQLGLEPGVNGQGYLIPYGRTCTFVPGWKGLVDLVSRSGRGTVYTGVIFRDQEYTYMDGARRDLVIHNQTELDAPEDITHAYAIGWVKDAAMPIIELWTVEKIKKHRDKYNKVGKNHYSFRDFEMYARKVPLLQVLKYMPASVEMANAIAISHASEAGRGATIENGIVIDNDPGPQDEQIACYTDADFAQSLPGWTRLIQSCKKTPDQIIVMAQSKAPLTDAQKYAIRAVAKAPPQSDADKLIDQMRAAAKAGDLDLLDTHASVIDSLSTEDQDNAAAIYQQLRGEVVAAQ